MARVEELAVSAGEATLSGTLALPDGPSPEGRYPNVLLLPSWLPRDRDGSWDRIAHAAWFAPGDDAGRGVLARLADALATNGVASLRVDPRGCAASEGDWGSTSLFTRIDDARDMVSALRGHPELDLRRTGIAGHGEGAAVALSVAIGDPAVSALTLIGPAARSWRDVLRRGVSERNRTGTDRQHPVVMALDRWSEEIIEGAERREQRFDLPIRGAGSVPLSLAGVEQAIHTPPLALATMLHRSVALVHGADDAWADPDESLLLADALTEGGNEVARRVVPGAGHDLADAPDALIADVASDLAARIRRVELPPVLVAIEEMTDGVR